MRSGGKLHRRIGSAPVAARVVIFLGLLLVVWAPLAFLVQGIGALLGQAQTASTIALVLLYGCFVGNAWWWGYWLHSWQRPFLAYGLVFDRHFLVDALIALLCGFGLVAFLFGGQILLGWASFYPRSLWGIALEGLAVAIGVGFAEELLFRGWLLAELQTSLSRLGALIWSSLIFAVAHFIKPLPDVLQTSPQFLGLLLLGLLLAAGRSSRVQPARLVSLSWPMGLHAGLVWGYYIVDVADLVLPSGRVPEWVTGIHGNPLAGLLGVTILGGLTVMALTTLRSK